MPGNNAMKDDTRNALVLETDPDSRLALVEMANKLGVATRGEASIDGLNYASGGIDSIDILLVGADMPGGARIFDVLARAKRAPKIILLGNEETSSCTTIMEYAASRGLTVAAVLNRPVQRATLRLLLGGSGIPPASGAPTLGPGIER